MPVQGQLEIINANGRVEFYNLDPGKGITNIGRHPENDVVLDHPGIAPFHAMVDHRQRPFQVMLLAQDGQTLVGGEPLLPNVSKALYSWTNLQLNGYTIVLIDGEDQPAIGRGFAARPGILPPPTTRPESVAGHPYPDAMPLGWAAAGAIAMDAMPPQVPLGFSQSVQEQSDEVILVEMGPRDQVIDVDQPAQYQLTVINGGDIVAMFRVDVVGVDPTWVTVSPPNVNLFEGDRTSITITILPPREPESRAGLHQLGFRVTSPNHPGRLSQKAATLTINPYYHFTVDELSPKQQTFSWFKRSGEVLLTVHNHGNSNGNFRLEAEDDEHGCSFEFNLPGEPTSRVRQADMNLPPDSMVSIPITISPRARPLVGFRKRHYSFTVTTSLPESAHVPRSMLGQLRTKPLLGLPMMLLLALLTLLLIVWIFIPRIRMFNVDGSQVRSVRSGEPVTLLWNASWLANLEVNPAIGQVRGPIGTATVIPTADVVIYTLKAENWLSRLAPRLFSASEQVQVFVTPVPPEIRFFEVDKNEILLGEEVNLSWNVSNADDLTLEINGLPQTLVEHAGTLTDNPDRETDYLLVASNVYRTERRNQRIVVLQPTLTPIPTPLVKKFIVNPSVIVAGESVQIEWEIEGADDVSVAPLGAGLPSIQTVEQFPLQTTNYVLNASNSGSARIDPIARVVYVTPAPTVTPEPDAPQIAFFVGDPETLISGKSPDEPVENQVQLTWSVKGTVTNVEISGPGLASPISNLSAADSINVAVEETTLFVLTAFNQDKKTSANVQITVSEATPTPSPTVPPTPAPTIAPLAKILEFRISEPGSPQVIKISDDQYQVQVNTKVDFTWQADSNAVGGTELKVDGSAIGSGGTSGVAPDIEITASKTYLLVAKNADGKETTDSIIVTVVDQPAPNPPYNVLGVETVDDNNTITWQWDFVSTKYGAIGFRIYRANVPGGSFAVIADESTLPNPDPTQDFSGSHQDSISPTCGKAYYVVAVYEKLDGSKAESPVSTNSWFSTPC